MIVVAEGGTDGANIVLFWPANLPEDAEARLRDDPMALIEQMRAEGRLVQFPCDSDGGYNVGIYVDEPIPPALESVCRDAESYPHLLVDGPGFFGGAEYVFKTDARQLERYPHMMQRVDLPPGTYAATAWRTEVPPESVDAWVLERAGARAKAVSSAHSAFAAVAVLAVLATLVSLFALKRSVVPLAASAVVAAVAVSATVLLGRTSAYRAVDDARKAHHREFPDYVLSLISQSSTAAASA